MEQKQLDELKAKISTENPGTETWIGSHPVTGDTWIYRPATRHEVKIYNGILRAEKEKGELSDFDNAYEMLIRSCLLFPDKDGITKMLAMRPLIAATIAVDICTVTGIRGEAEQKKF